MRGDRLRQLPATAARRYGARYVSKTGTTRPATGATPLQARTCSKNPEASREDNEGGRVSDKIILEILVK